MSLITISRMVGAGGAELAARVAATLGWQLVDNELVDSVAERLGVPVSEVFEREEKVPTLAQRLADALALGAPEVFTGGPTTLPPSEERILEVTANVIEEAVAAGPTVMVGRGAQWVLGEREHSLHVFCFAAPSELAARVSTRLSLSLKDAEKYVIESNRQREQYVRSHWNRSWLAHENYHLCLNTGWLGIDGAAEIVVQVAREHFG
ncbi:MAG: cytidylate kinase-like family protein [Gemmatimonadaceae bacterium]